MLFNRLNLLKKDKRDSLYLINVFINGRSVKKKIMLWYKLYLGMKKNLINNDINNEKLNNDINKSNDINNESSKALK